MTTTLILVLALSVLIGLSLGVLGGGGSILTVPILVYVAGFEAKEAIAASLFVVGVTSAVSVFSHARAGRVMWRTGLLFGAAGMAGAFVGGLLGGHIPGQILLIAFALMMVATSIAMIRGRKKKADAGTEAPKHTELPLFRVLLDGLVVGLVTGLVGAGGGFLVVPALALLGGLPMAIAVGTSLVVIAMKSFAGLAGYLTTVELDWGITLAVTAAAIVGTLIGSKLAGRIPEAALRKGFGWFVLVMGAFVLIQQAPVDLRGPIALGVAGAALVAAAVCWFFVSACPLRRSNRTTRQDTQPTGVTGLTRPAPPSITPENERHHHGRNQHHRSGPAPEPGAGPGRPRGLRSRRGHDPRCNPHPHGRTAGPPVRAGRRGSRHRHLPQRQPQRPCGGCPQRCRLHRRHHGRRHDRVDPRGPADHLIRP